MRKFILSFIAVVAMLFVVSTADARGPRGAFRGGNRGFGRSAFGLGRGYVSPFRFNSFRPNIIVAVQPSAFFGFQSITLSSGLIYSVPTNANLIVGSEYLIVSSEYLIP